ncbi:extracellular sulfatase Sulf-2-like isoform X2 [Tubulanus polymorphus]|uniref:extracellular sulfatase Sulf-2-like isoform X2 n=1 Tax=Tubulanus polymorphus TaxID=672921 RepID=UPI003DA2809F
MTSEEPLKSADDCCKLDAVTSPVCVFVQCPLLTATMLIRWDMVIVVVISMTAIIATVTGNEAASSVDPTERVVAENNNDGIRTEDELRARWSKKSSRKNLKRSKKPNIVIILTDDQDSELGSLNYMPKTLRILRQGGATFTNSFVTTPMCCPSRSSFLTGMYVHNHNTYTNNDNCSSIQWQQQYETKNFGTYLSNAGYRTGYFGKYLNQYNGSYIPPGWREWVGLVRNSRFYNYTLNFNGQKVKHGDNYYQDYLTDLIANDSVTFLKQSKQYFPNRPVAMVLSTPAPHGPEDSAPQYQHMFKNNSAHRTVSWNYAPNPDKQWLLQQMGKMQPIEIAFTDILQTKRLQTLQSVDDAVEKVYYELKNLGELRNTYIIYTSDHGYHLGQFGLLKGKAMPYEFDVRVPFLIRGPGIPHGIRIPNIVINLDVAPTLLDIAGVPVPEHMDGRSILPLLEYAKDPNNNYKGLISRKKAWRDTFLIERGKITFKKIMWRERVEAAKNNLLSPKELRIKEQCLKPDYQLPCKIGQKWFCNEDKDGHLYIAKCRNNRFTATDTSLPPIGSGVNRRCRCRKNGVSTRRSKRRLRKGHLQFGSSSVKGKRFDSTTSLDTDSSRTMRQKRSLPWTVNTGSWGVTLHDADRALYSRDDAHILKKCQVTANNSVVCQEDVYNDIDSWKSHKQELSAIIEQYKKRLDSLKDIRRHLKRQRPFIRESTTTAVPTAMPTSDASPKQHLEPPSSVRKNPLESVINTDEEDADTTVEIIPDGPFSEEKSNEEFEEANSAETAITDTEIMQKNTIVAEVTGLELLPPEVTGGGGGTDNDDDDDEDKLLEASEDENCNCDVIDNRITEDNRRTKQRLARLEERHQRRKQRRQWKNEKKRQRRRHKGKTCNPLIEKCHKRNPHTGQPTPRKDPMCYRPGLQCQRMDNSHWKTAPHWTLGPFCFCPNSNNNTYWCLRTINETHNFLYCEYISGFLSFYDLNNDPFQLRNAILDLDYGIIHQMAEMLHKLQRCKGARECTVRTRGRDGKLYERKNGKIDQSRFNHRPDKKTMTTDKRTSTPSAGSDVIIDESPSSGGAVIGSGYASGGFGISIEEQQNIVKIWSNDKNDAPQDTDEEIDLLEEEAFLPLKSDHQNHFKS